ncbi:hypothetical protein BDZ91DRAFT_673610 [Kalaharituber pfeilii]|nr:hypothetical protein BDZ91DRAFT_673610 [Kalaharituber pfeilii]
MNSAPHYRPSPGVPSHRSPTQTQPRRGPGPMVTNTATTPHQPLTPAQIHHQQQIAQQERELAKRRARKPTDKTIPDSLEKLVPNVKLYRELRDVERRYDATIMRKRLDIQDAVNRNVKNYKTLRIWISNTAKDQPWQNSDRPLDENAFDFETGQIPTFRLRIEGRLLDDEDGDDEESEAERNSKAGASLKSESAPGAAPQKPVRKFSSFFKSIVVELDRSNNLYPEGNIIEWRRPLPIPPQQPGGVPQQAQIPEFDGFEFERKGDVDVPCTIKLERNEMPDRYRLSPQLSELLDTKEDTRAGIVMGLWEYVRKNKLQDPDERRTINCDAALKAIFNQDRLYFPQIPDLTVAHLLPLEPIVLHYKIRVDKASHSAPYAYDIAVPIDDPIRAKMSAILPSHQYLTQTREILAIDDQIATIVQAINHSKAKRDFWMNMALDPKGFVDRWVASQKRDLEVILGENGGIEMEETRRKDFYERALGEGVLALLTKHQQMQAVAAMQGQMPMQ